MTHPAPTRADHDRFCRNEGWRRVRDARGRTGTHHVTYELELPDGRVLRTRISHPPDRSTYGAALWAHILRDQLDVTEEEFWACVRGEDNPDRGEPREPVDALPAELAHQLIKRFHVPETEVRQMSKADAIARLQQLWSERT